jgi:arylsulfatase A-like enzyme
LFSNRSLDVDHSAEIYDIAPTVAAALGIPIDAQTDGAVLLDTEETRNRRDWDELAEKFSGLETETDTQSVEDRLADLGYME